MQAIVPLYSVSYATDIYNSRVSRQRLFALYYRLSLFFFPFFFFGTPTKTCTARLLHRSRSCSMYIFVSPSIRWCDMSQLRWLTPSHVDSKFVCKFTIFCTRVETRNFLKYYRIAKTALICPRKLTLFPIFYWLSVVRVAASYLIFKSWIRTESMSISRTFYFD